MDPKLIARVAHEADRTLAAINGDMTIAGWNALEAWQRHSAVQGVKAAIATPGADADALHNSWLRDKQDAGWSWGLTLDIDRKTDPLLVPWDQLSCLRQRREGLFLAMVRSLSREI